MRDDLNGIIRRARRVDDLPRSRGPEGRGKILIAAAIGATWPGFTTAAAAAGVGLVGYGVSLALFVLALRDLGAARTGAYFSTAPFVGVAISRRSLGRQPSRSRRRSAATVASPPAAS